MSATVPPGLAEQTEIEAYADFTAGSPAPVREMLGIGSLRLGPALAMGISADPSRFFNRAGGFGAEEPVTADVLAWACGFYRDLGVSQGRAHARAVAAAAGLGRDRGQAEPHRRATASPSWGAPSRPCCPRPTESRHSIPDYTSARSSPAMRRSGPRS